MNKKITLKTNPDKILKLFKDCNDTSSVNLEIPNGHIYLVGGILNKLENNIHYIAMNNKWVEC